MFFRYMGKNNQRKRFIRRLTRSLEFFAFARPGVLHIAFPSFDSLSLIFFGFFETANVCDRNQKFWTNISRSIRVQLLIKKVQASSILLFTNQGALINQSNSESSNLFGVSSRATSKSSASLIQAYWQDSLALDALI
ncbi:hypothetical protein HanIR_Chr14g0701681 [Helianthus annuus]|nr:hypothetical protein HanIR_Chr14g0701681 [Helianthus annuus]